MAVFAKKQDVTWASTIMARIQPASYPEQDEPESSIQRLTAEQVRELRERQPQVSPWRVVWLQASAGGLMSLLAWEISGRHAAWSAAYGVLTVVLPAAVMARGITGRLASVNVTAAALGFLVWEAVKIMLSVAMLLVAGRLIEGLSWPALLVAMIFTMKIHWLAIGLGRRLAFTKQN
jgi:ATP synthase protein I